MTEDNIRTFVDNWTGTAEILNGDVDAERLSIGPGEYMESEIWLAGLQLVEILTNQYIAGDTVLVKYKTAADPDDIPGAALNDYTVPFYSLGYVMVRLEVAA